MTYTTQKRIANVRTFRSMHISDTIYLRWGCPVEYKNYDRFRKVAEIEFPTAEALSAFLHSSRGKIYKDVRIHRGLNYWLEILVMTR